MEYNLICLPQTFAVQIVPGCVCVCVVMKNNVTVSIFVCK